MDHGDLIKISQERGDEVVVRSEITKLRHCRSLSSNKAYLHFKCARNVCGEVSEEKVSARRPIPSPHRLVNLELLFPM